MMNETDMEMFMMSYLISLLFSLGISLISYVFTSMGYYTLAKRRGLNKPWLAWIPVGNLWIMGSLSDQYRYVTRGQVTNKRKVLLGLSIPVYALLAVLIGLYVNIFIEILPLIEQTTATDAQIMGMAAKLIGILGICFVLLVVSIVAAVFQYIVIYDVFRSCDPDNSVLFLVLSILRGVVYPFFVFACRNKDLGMPPRNTVNPAVEPLE